MRRLLGAPRSKCTFGGWRSSPSKRQCGRYSGCVLIIENCHDFSQQCPLKLFPDSSNIPHIKLFRWILHLYFLLHFRKTYYKICNQGIFRDNVLTVLTSIYLSIPAILFNNLYSYVVFISLDLFWIKNKEMHK